MDDELLDVIERCRNGDQRAWPVLIDRFAGLVYAIARAHKLSEDLCDDVAQVVFSNLSRSLENLKEPRALPAWLSTTTRRECWRLAKARKRFAQAPISPEAEMSLAADTPTDQDLNRIEAAHRVRAGLERLGERCRTLLLALFGSAPVDYQQIGERLGIPAGSIGPTRQRCLAKLAEILGE